MPEEQQWIETDDENALRAHIFQKDDRAELLIEVPEWDTKILIKALTGTARSEFLAFQSALSRNYKDTGEYWKRVFFEMARLGCVHPKTKRPIFKMADQDTLMNEHNGEVIETLGKTVQAFCSLDGTTGERARKNLLGIQSTTTTTDSQNNSAETTGE
jgi:hypothetical protein